MLFCHLYGFLIGYLRYLFKKKKPYPFIFFRLVSRRVVGERHHFERQGYFSKSFVFWLVTNLVDISDFFADIQAYLCHRIPSPNHTLSRHSATAEAGKRLEAPNGDRSGDTEARLGAHVIFCLLKSGRGNCPR